MKIPTFPSSLRQHLRASLFFRSLLPFFRQWYADPYYFTGTLFLFSTLFVFSNLTLLICTTFFFLLLLWRTQFEDFTRSIFFFFVLTLPFAKGKTLEILLLKSHLAETAYSLYDLKFLLPIFLSDIFLALLLYVSLKKKRSPQTQKSQTKTLLPTALFLAYLSVSLATAFWASFTEPVLLSFLELARLLIVFLLAHIHSGDALYVKKAILLQFIFQTLMSTLQFITQSRLGRYIEAVISQYELGIRSFEENIFRASGTFFEPSIFGTFLIIALVVLHTWIKKLTHPWQYAVWGLFFMGMISTGSRALIIASLLIFGIYGRHLLDIKLKKRLTLTLTLVGIGCFVFWQFVLPRFATLHRMFGPEGSGTYRIHMSHYSLRLALEQPFGVGPSLTPFAFATEFPNSTFVFDPAQPHNIFLQVLTESGFLGLIFFCAFLISCFAQTPHKKNVFFLAALAYLLAAQIYPIYFQHKEILTFLFLCLGLGLAQKKESREQ